MPLNDFLKNYKPGDDFTYESFRDAVQAEFEKDETAWRAAVTIRDETIAKTSADLTKAQAAAWEAYQNAPAGNADTETAGGEPDEDSLDAIRARVFTPIERK